MQFKEQCANGNYILQIKANYCTRVYEASENCLQVYEELALLLFIILIELIMITAV